MMGKSGEIWGTTFPRAKKVVENIGTNLGANFGRFVSNLASFFNFVQQKGDVNLGERLRGNKIMGQQDREPLRGKSASERSLRGPLKNL